MSKHVALGLTMRHMTGSSSIIGILNGLGHSVSDSVVMVLNPFHVLTVSPSISQKNKKRCVDPPPNALEVYHKRKRQGPIPTSYQNVIHEHSTNEHLQSTQSLDIAYCLSKLQELDGHILPGWAGYNTLLNSTTIPPVSKLGYLPVIDASPTRIDTVYTILTQSVAIADSLELGSLVLVMDQATYPKAQQIRWQNDSFKERLFIRYGDFHTAMAYLGIIGKRFQDSGLEDILIEADIVAPGSIKSIFSGHHYNRSIRAKKMMYEALVRLRWKALLEASSADECDSALDLAK